MGNSLTGDWASGTSGTANAGANAAARAGFLSLVLLSAGHFFIDMYSSAIGAFQPLLVQKLHLSLKQAGLAGGMMILFSSVMQPAYGYLSDRLHTRMFSALAPAVAGIAVSCLGLANSYNSVLLMVAVGGAGIASFHPQASAWATAGIHSRRGRWMAVFISAGTLGMAFGPLVFSAIMARKGLQGSWIGAIPGILATLVLIAWLPLSAPAESHRRKRFNMEPLKAVWKPMTILYFLVFIRSAIQLTFAQFLPLYLQRERGFRPTESNYALSLYLGVGAIGGFAGGYLSDRWGGRTVIFLSMLLSVPALALFFLASGPAAIAGLMLGGLTLLFTVPVNVVMAQDLAPGQAGTVSALMMGFAWGMSGIIFIPLTGVVADASSMHVALFSLLVLPVVGVFLSLKLPRAGRTLAAAV